MVSIFKLDIPKIEVSEKQIFFTYNNEKNQLLFTGGKSFGSEVPLSFKNPENIGKSDVVATMSYKMIGQKLAKKISIKNGFDFYFAYDKSTGYFDKQRSLISPHGNEYSVYNVGKEDFYSELIDVLKLRLALGYIGSDDKKQSADFYFRNAHKYILMNKYDLRLDESMNFLRGIVDKSYIPEEFTEGFLNELRKSFYDGELSKTDLLKIETKAKISLLNEKKGKVAFDDFNLYSKVLREMRSQEADRQLNMARLLESMQR